MESGVHAAVPLRVGKKMRKRRELDALVVGLRGGRLLSASSDEGEPWGRRTTRRRRSRPYVRLAAALALCICVVSAATVLWLFVDVRRQIVSLRIEMDGVSTSSKSVGDALQICHSAAKVLRANATDLNNRLTQLEQDHLELGKRVEEATKSLESVTRQLEATPNIVDMPRRLAELQRTVADFGSQIKSFESSFNLTKRQASTAIAGVDELKTLLNQLEIRTNETAANITANIKRDEDIKSRIESLNTTLQSKMEALLANIQENNKKAMSTAAPTTGTVTTSSSTIMPANNVTSQAPTLPPGPPAKPNILQ